MVECSICTVECWTEQSTVIEQSTVCHGCIRHMFKLALADNAIFPPRWGPHVVLSIHTYAHILSQDTLQKYWEKDSEYRCPPVDRVYCPWAPQVRTGENHAADLDLNSQCNNYVDRRCITPVQKVCCKCERLVCLACRGRRLLGAPHRCGAQLDLDDAIAFEGLVRGRDYQVCPSNACKRRVQLSEGCNQITCVCGAQFCFLCGTNVLGQADHWTREQGNCPRFGFPSGAGAIWDPHINPWDHPANPWVPEVDPPIEPFGQQPHPFGQQPHPFGLQHLIPGYIPGGPEFLGARVVNTDSDGETSDGETTSASSDEEASDDEPQPGAFLPTLNWPAPLRRVESTGHLTSEELRSGLGSTTEASWDTLENEEAVLQRQELLRLERARLIREMEDNMHRVQMGLEEQEILSPAEREAEMATTRQRIRSQHQRDVRNMLRDFGHAEITGNQPLRGHSRRLDALEDREDANGVGGEGPENQRLRGHPDPLRSNPPFGMPFGADVAMPRNQGEGDGFPTSADHGGDGIPNVINRARPRQATPASTRPAPRWSPSPSRYSAFLPAPPAPRQTATRGRNQRATPMHTAMGRYEEATVAVVGRGRLRTLSTTTQREKRTPPRSAMAGSNDDSFGSQTNGMAYRLPPDEEEAQEGAVRNNGFGLGPRRQNSFDEL